MPAGSTRPVAPRALAASAAVRCSFDRQALDGAAVRAALLDLVVRLGLRLNRRGQAARTQANAAVRGAGPLRIIDGMDDEFIVKIVT